MSWNHAENLKRRYGITLSEYDAVHRWVRKNFGSATKCENPECSGNFIKFHWAKKKHRAYIKKRENFWQLCVGCHVKQDKTKMGIKSAIKKLRKMYEYKWKKNEREQR